MSKSEPTYHSIETRQADERQKAKTFHLSLFFLVVIKGLRNRVFSEHKLFDRNLGKALLPDAHVYMKNRTEISEISDSDVLENLKTILSG